MPGDRQGPLADPIVVALFRHAMRVQALWVLGVALVAVGIFVVVRNPATTPVEVEARSRTWLRWSFGLLWLIDGVLQFQPSMPLGLGNQVVAPSAEGTPWWLHDVVNGAVDVWNRHPVALASAAVWIEFGIGLALLASRGTVSRVAAAVSVLWGLIVWTGANAMGGIFSTNASILFGWPGAVLFYVVAGLWLAGPPRWFPEDFSRFTLRGSSVLFAVAALIQCLPSHGFWGGGPDNPLAAMAATMTGAAQPSWLSSVVVHGANLGATMGGGFNLIVIFWLAITALGLWRMSTSDVRWPLWSTLAGAAWIWVIAQDTGLFGGLSTDLNSMVPLAMLVWCAGPARRSAAPLHLGLRDAPRRAVAVTVGALAAAMVIVAAIPMASATLRSAETTLFIARNGSYSVVPPTPAPRFALVDQHLVATTFPATGPYQILTFLDPNCNTDCRLMALQLKQLDRTLSPAERARVRYVAVAADPLHQSVADVRGFIERYRLGSMHDFHFVTGPYAKVQSVWRDYGIDVSISPGQVMSVHTDVVYVIDPRGRIRVIVGDDPPEGTAGRDSAVTTLTQALHDAGLR